MILSSALSKQFLSLRGYAGGLAWSPLLSLARTACAGLLTKIQIGRLEITDEAGELLVCGDHDPAASPAVELKVHNEAFWVRLLLFADMGFAESYMLAEFSCRDLTSFFKLFILNKTHLSNGTTLTASISSSISGFLRAANNLTTARLNIAAHYDISNAMFAAFLSPDMTYSCPIWLPKNHPDSEGEALESAQDRKLDRFIRNARLKPTDRVLEIGTGWGSFAIRAVRQTGCTVTSLTLSKEQKELAEERIQEAGLCHKIQVLLCDYRALQVPEDGPFDKIVSIEMLEAVGREYLETYFRCIDKFLKTNGGIAVFQCITIPEARYEAYAKGDDFIRRYIFPGGHLPTVTQLVQSITAGSKGTIIVDEIENIGPHYAKTLRIWKENFLGNFNDVIRPALLREHEEMSKADVETFRRKWEYYFTYCEAGFATKTLGDVIITCSREGALEMLEDVPL